MPEIDDEALEWVVRQAAGELDDGARADFEAWYGANPRHQGAYLRARAIQHSLDQLTLQESQRPAPADCLNDHDFATPRHVGSRRAFMVSGALAAGLATVAVLNLQPLGDERRVFETAKGELRKVPLADRSVISVNGSSRVEVELTAAERRVHIKDGEAWFDVAKDKTRPFIVATGDVRVRAVGTAFAVRRHGAGTEVSVTEGVVEVWNVKSPTRKKRLAAGGQGSLADNSLDIVVTRDPSGIERRLAWREGQLVFQNELLANAVADFNRYNVRQIVIADPALGRKMLVGTYRIDRPENFADDVRDLLNVPLVVTADSIRIGVAPGARRVAGGR